MIEINVERFCVLSVKVGGHKRDKCPQCKALKAIVLLTHNQTIDNIVRVLKTVPEGEVLDPLKAIPQIEKLKTHPENIGG